VKYVFETAEKMLVEELRTDSEMSAMFADIRAFCAGRTHNIWGNNRNEDTPRGPLSYDIVSWMHAALDEPLSVYKFSSPVTYRFDFSEAKKEEMAALIERYGTTSTGIGRIIIQMNRDRVWREPMPLRQEQTVHHAATA
jgi:hypothetical protein